MRSSPTRRSDGSPALRVRLSADLMARTSRAMVLGARDLRASNPRSASDAPWAALVAGRHGEVRSEWDRFVADGGRLPRLDDLVDEDQGAEGAWRAGLLVNGGRPAGPLPSLFPATMDVLRQIPGLRAAVWSVFEPGTELPSHQGPNAGILRFHLGVACGPATALQVGEEIIAYRDGRTILFDDTVPHAAWNRGDRNRATLMCEVLRPAAGWTGVQNRLTQGFLARDPRYRLARSRAREWHAALNPHCAPQP